MDNFCQNDPLILHQRFSSEQEEPLLLFVRLSARPSLSTRNWDRVLDTIQVGLSYVDFGSRLFNRHKRNDRAAQVVKYGWNNFALCGACEDG